MHILKIRKDANSPWETLDVIVGPVGPQGPQGEDYILTDADKREIAGYINLSSYATIKYVDDKIANAQPDLSNYYTKAQTNNKIEEAVAAIPATDLSNYYTMSQTDKKIEDAVADLDIPEQDLSDYATKEYVDTEIVKVATGGTVDLSNYYTKSQVDALIPDTSGFALKTDIPSLEGYAKLTDIPDTSNFTTMTAVEAKGYQTKAQVQALITASLPASGEEVSY